MAKGAVWTNWSGAVSAHPAAIWHPRTEDELAALVRGSSGVIRPAGSGHSFTRLNETQGALVLFDHLQGVIAADASAGEAEVFAGTPIHALGPALHAHGLALPNQGDIDRQTLAGAISTGTHGTGETLGALPVMVTGVTLIDATGTRRQLDAASDPAGFEAARLSLGALGLITRFKLKLNRSYALSEQSFAMDAAQALETFDAQVAAHRHFEFFWFPYAEQVVGKTLDLADSPPSRPPHDAALMKARGETRSRDDRMFEILCGLVKRMPRLSGWLHRYLTGQMARTEARPGRVRWSYEAFPSARTVRFNEMEFAVPRAQARACLTALVARIRKDKIPTAFPIEVRTVKADDVWLSPFYGRDSVTFSVHQFAKMDETALFAACEEVFLAHQGRPHWGKRHSQTGRELAWMYPQWSVFHEARRRFDPGERFVSPYLRTLFESGFAGPGRSD